VEGEVLHAGDLTLYPDLSLARLDEKTVPLSATEFTLLEHLVRNRGKVLTREELLQHVWQYDFGGDSNVLHVYISYLRGKLEQKSKPKKIHTVRGVGYRFGEPL
jgi:DNA-binding response OmpR family regulator